MRKKFTPVLDQLLPGLVLLALGIMILYWKANFLWWTLLLVELVCLVSGLAKLVMLLLRRKELGGKRITLSGALVSVGIGVAMGFVLDYQVYILGLLFAVYVLINAAAKLVNFILFAKNKVKGRLTDLFDCLFFLTFGILLLFTPILPLDSFLIIIGVYAVLLGSFNLLEFGRSMLPARTKTRMRRKVRISLPVFLVAFVPHRVLKRINAYLSQNADGVEGPEEFTQYKDNVPAETPDLEVFIHVTEGGSGAMGHCDFCFDGHVISYGNYDEYSRRLFEGVGDGVLFYAPKEKYVPFVIRYSRKTLFGFGLKLTEEQKQAVRKRLEQITAPLYRWKSPYEWDLEHKCAKALDYYPDYASQLYRYTDAEFYKFNSGKFKSYFVLSTNCVQLVDAVLSSAGTDIVKINGIITPGTYYDYLDREFVRPGSMVVSRTIYAEDPDNPSEVPRESDVRARYKELCQQEKQALRVVEESAKTD